MEKVQHNNKKNCWGGKKKNKKNWWGGKEKIRYQNENELKGTEES